MRRLLTLVVAFVLIPTSAALGAELEELLDQSRNASYSAEQVISCATPDGVRQALIRLSQSGGEVRVENAVEPGVVVSSGAGGWVMAREGTVVDSAVVPPGEHAAVPRYRLEGGDPVVYLGREATAYRLVGEEGVRAELVFDNAVGALVETVTYSTTGEVYCERRFISFDPTIPVASPTTVPLQSSGLEAVAVTDLPSELAGFQLLDSYQDPQGFSFAYYSDGFFSFAVFRTPFQIEVSDAAQIDLGRGPYFRSFAPGQVTYAWETATGGMALVGDLPPDMHQPVLDTLPSPEPPGFLRRLWRTLFG